LMLPMCRGVRFSFARDRRQDDEAPEG
jgi:hypothetical protein